MRYFTPELYLRGNSADDEEADRAEADWEEAIREYRVYLAAHSSEMNDRVRNLAEKLHLHGAELLSLHEDAPGPALSAPVPAPSRVAAIALQMGGEVTDLLYFLWGPATRSEPDGSWPFSKSRTCWLYDEVEVEGRPPDPPLYRHCILWSDGSISTIPFLDVVIRSFPTPGPTAVSAAAQRT